MKGLIFDLGGVVVEWSNAVTYGYIEERYGIPADEFRREAEKGMPRVQTGEETEENWMRSIFQRFDHPEGSEEVWGKTFEAAKYNEEVFKIIERLRGKGYRVAALSNLEPSRARWLKKHGVDELFDAVIFSCEVGMRKPDLSPGNQNDLAIYLLTLSRLGLEAEDCIFVDDNVNCVAAAELTGMKSILFKDAAKLSEELREMGVV
ncbi:MAG: HAD family phosphatase [Candidatus Bathyarchaeota archaeon]|nr:HAD family phosphatase [Candidatus Bathyarchaeota archaeon]